MKTIANYTIEWSIDSNTGLIQLKFTDGEERIVEDLDFETFMALVKILEKGSARFDPAKNSIYKRL
ncbi:hypothetical protein HNP38_001782 [Chryseobacterium defluvii]|uniref:KTSC domain-containing protein n=1 Tax=Chryseobacterium defluvii TaxID=160396 RepID=A0A840KBB3_9FLAO|nr:hypothetical protein [Chryseobacterium defluvii]MBB4806486.1 hypothetical protein [Chryseobacterium defluvii]